MRICAVWSGHSSTFTTVYIDSVSHYENTPIQIYRKFHLQKLKVFKYKFWYFYIFAKNIDCEYSLEPPRVLEAVPTSTHNLWFWAEIRKIMYTSVKPSFTIWKWGLRGSKLYRYDFVMGQRRPRYRSAWRLSRACWSASCIRILSVRCASYMRFIWTISWTLVSFSSGRYIYIYTELWLIGLGFR